MARGYLDESLITFLREATHVQIRCAAPGGGCGHSSVMLTRDLVAKLPHAETVSHFQNKMICSRCRLRGWSEIRPAQRG